MPVIIAVVLLSLTTCSEADSRGMKLSIKDDQGRDVGYYTGSYALVVGVSRYNKGWPVLESIPSEVSQVERALEAGGFKVTKVIDPDSQQLKAAFEDFMDLYGYDRGNRLLFFFSGHGYTLDRGRRGYLVPVDAPDPNVDERNFRRRALDMTDIMAWCRKMQVNHAIFLFDSCFSGTIFKTRDLPKVPPHINALTAKPVRQFISAGTAGQSVPARSVFTPTFLKGLRGGADYNKDKFVTGTELGMYLQTWVTDYASAQGCPQTPQYGKLRDPELDEGDFVFVCDNNMLMTPVVDFVPSETAPPVGPMVVQYTGTLVVESPERGTVSVDGGQSYDIIPGKGLKWDRIAVGAHEVAVAAGDKTWKDTVIVRKDQSMTAQAVFGPTAGEDLTVDLGGGVKMELVWIPPGSFIMGSSSNEDGRFNDENQHRVMLTKGFWMGKYEVTQEQWEQVMGNNPSNFKNAGKKAPVEGVSWDDCLGFMRKLNSKGIEGTFRLPTEAEWEYACRAGSDTAIYNGQLTIRGQRNGPELDVIAWYGGNSGVSYSGGYDSSDWKEKQYNHSKVGAHPVGKKKSNAWGLHDMLGNVWEWCSDWYGNYPTGITTDQTGAASGAGRVIRGGSWSSYARLARSASRLHDAPTARISTIGFRVVLFR